MRTNIDFKIPSKYTTWQSKIRYVWAAKRKLYALAKAKDNKIDETKFYELLTEIGYARSRLRKREMSADMAQEDALHDDANGYPADRPSQKAMHIIIESLTKDDLGDVVLPSVSKAEVS